MRDRTRHARQGSGLEDQARSLARDLDESPGGHKIVGPWKAQWLQTAGLWGIYRVVRWVEAGRVVNERREGVGPLYSGKIVGVIVETMNRTDGNVLGEVATGTRHGPGNGAMNGTGNGVMNGAGHGIGAEAGARQQSGAVCRQCQINDVEVQAARLCRPCYNRMRRMGLTSSLGWCECGHPAKIVMTATTHQGEETYALCAGCAAEELHTRAVLASVGRGQPVPSRRRARTPDTAKL